MDKKVVNILIVNDSYLERMVLSYLIRELSKYYDDLELILHTSNNGIAGVGYIFITKPEIVILDSTLPGFSGYELMNYLKKNADEINKFSELLTIILHHDDSLNLNDAKFITFDKSQKTFLTNLKSMLRINLMHMESQGANILTDNIIWEEDFFSNIRLSFYKRIFKLQNNADKVILNKKTILVEKILNYTIWFLLEIIAEINYLIMKIFTGSFKEDSIVYAPESEDFRVNFYPSLILGFIAFILILLQILGVYAGINAIIAEVLPKSLFFK